MLTIHETDPEADEDLDLDIDDEEPPSKKRVTGSRDKSKIAHSTAEKKRRDAIKNAYTNLTDAITSVSEEEKKKLTRADILDLALNSVENLKSNIDERKAERESLQRKLHALSVIAGAYESMPKTAEKSSIPPDMNCVVSNHIKLKLFTTLLSKQFESFSGVINTENLKTLTASLFYWVEVHWRPIDLKEYLIGLLKVLRNRFVDKTPPMFMVPGPSRIGRDGC